MKKIALLAACILSLALVLTACAPSPSVGEPDTTKEPPQKSTEKENEFYDLVCETQELLDIVGDDIYSYWYDCIYKDKYLESIDYAIACAMSDNQENIDTIEANTLTIKDLYKEVKDGDLKSEVKAVMQAYNDYYALVIEVSGSFKSYSENKESLKKELASALDDLSFELD